MVYDSKKDGFQIESKNLNTVLLMGLVSLFKKDGL